jgi:hypothetical protein
MHRKKVIIWAIVVAMAIPALIRLQIYHTKAIRKTQETMRLLELENVLIQYVNENKGCLPRSWSELAKSKFVSVVTGPEKELWMVGPNQRPFSPLRGSDEFLVAFGESGKTIIVGEKNSIRKLDGQPLLLIQGTSISQLEESIYKHYSWELGTFMEQADNDKSGQQGY